MPGRSDDRSLAALIDEEPRDFVTAVWEHSRGVDGTLKSDAFIRLAVALADIEGINLLAEFNDHADVVEAVTGQELVFPEHMVSKFDSLDWLSEGRS